MKITCDSCGAKYTIADDKVRGRKVKIRCKGCGTPIVVDGAQKSGAPGAADEAGTEGETVPIDTAGAPDAGEWSVNLSETDQRTLTTQQLVEGWANGTVTADAFVWKEGMPDWLPILECAELSGSLSAPPPQAPAQPQAQPAAVLPKAASARPGATAARVSGGRGQVGTDLFAGVEQAGADFEDINTSAPALPGARSAAEDARPTGQRNENSVLFSLDALKAGFAGPAPAKAEAPKRGGARAQTAAPEDPFGLGAGGVAGLGGGGPMFSLADNNALLTAPAPPEPPKPVISFAVDPSGSAPAARSSKKGLALGILAVLLVGGVAGAYAISANKEKEEALAAAAAAAASAEKAREEERKARAAEERAREEQKEQEAKAAALAAANANKPEKPEEKAPAGEAASSEPTKSAASTGSKASAKKDDPKKEEAKPAAAAGGDQPFSKAAAVGALGAAAGSAGSCKKLGGPTGAGRVTVTFATSGRVTTANVTGSPYAGTSVGGCVASIFRKAKVPPFSGSPVTVSKSFAIN